MPVPFSNMNDIIYCHNSEIAEDLFHYLRGKGHPVGLSSSVIDTGTHGKQPVKRLDVFKIATPSVPDTDYVIGDYVTFDGGLIGGVIKELAEYSVTIEEESGFSVTRPLHQID